MFGGTDRWKEEEASDAPPSPSRLKQRCEISLLDEAATDHVEALEPPVLQPFSHRVVTRIDKGCRLMDGEVFGVVDRNSHEIPPVFVFSSIILNQLVLSIDSLFPLRVSLRDF